MDVAEEARAGQIVFRVAEEAFGRGAGVGEGEVGVEQRHAAPALLDQRAETLLAIFELDAATRLRSEMSRRKAVKV